MVNIHLHGCISSLTLKVQQLKILYSLTHTDLSDHLKVNVDSSCIP